MQDLELSSTTDMVNLNIEGVVSEDLVKFFEACISKSNKTGDSVYFNMMNCLITNRTSKKGKIEYRISLGVVKVI